MLPAALAVIAEGFQDGAIGDMPVTVTACRDAGKFAFQLFQV
jgi:hypothetical protein